MSRFSPRRIQISSLVLALSLCTIPAVAQFAHPSASNVLTPTTTVAWELEQSVDPLRSGYVAPWKAQETWYLAALRDGVVLRTERIGHGITNPFKAEVEYDEHRIYAVWKPIVEANFDERETYEAEVAAYRLSAELGLDMVPPTVERKIGRRWGSLQLWVDNHRMFSDVMDERPDGYMGSDQFQLMRFFDALIDNPDRNAGNYLVDRAWQIVLIDHSRAMDFAARGPKRDAPMPHRYERNVVERLRSLDVARLHELLGDLYTKGEIKRLVGSANKLLSFVDREVELHGHNVVFFERPERKRQPTFATAQLRFPAQPDTE